MWMYQKEPFEVYRLDLSESKPKLAAEKQVIHTQQTFIGDICFVHYGDKQLLVVAARDAGLFAYNAGTDKLEWKVEGKVTGMERALDALGVTTNGRGHLFVADDKCIHMFSTSEGQYLGRLIKRCGNTWQPRKSTLECRNIVSCGRVFLAREMAPTVHQYSVLMN